MKISIIIPNYNNKETLNQCLDSIKNLKNPPFEVIVIDDYSTDGSEKIVKNPNKLIRLEQNGGPARARNIGAKNAKGDFLLFIDSDVLLEKNIIIEIEKILKNKIKAIIQGVYSKRSKHPGICNRFKDIYYNYYFNRNTGDFTKTLSTHCFLIEKELFLVKGGFNENIKNASIEDAEFGKKIDNEKIFLGRNVKVTHLKNYNLTSLLKTDYKMAKNKIKSIIRQRHKGHLINATNNKEDTISMILEVIIVSLIPINLLLLILKSNILKLSLIFLIIAYTLINFSFFREFYKNRISITKIFFLNYIDKFVISLGLICGLITYFFKRY
ncbi:MAG: glycosyltransferase family 2 protein [Nanoarchaeota archaeon]|nr:glycosyltransferase family 2 protein [Nanoarchaeota archaeon]